jgi:CheY-like chemotaxis protein
VILLDIELPGTNGIDAIPKLKKLLPQSLYININGLRIRKVDIQCVG